MQIPILAVLLKNVDVMLVTELPVHFDNVVMIEEMMDF